VLQAFRQLQRGLQGSRLVVLERSFQWGVFLGSAKTVGLGVRLVGSLFALALKDAEGRLGRVLELAKELLVFRVQNCVRLRLLADRTDLFLMHLWGSHLALGPVRDKLLRDRELFGGA